MPKSSAILVFLTLLFLLTSCMADEIIPDLTVNYSDFSYITSIAVGYHYIYFGTTSGITRYSVTEGKWVEPMTAIGGSGWQVIHQIKASFDDEDVWVKTDLGIFEYSEILKGWSQISEMPDVDTRARHLLPNDVFFAPWGYDYLPGGVLIDAHDRRFPLTDIVDDGWTNLWMGIWGLGAARADNSGRRIELLPYGLLQKDITTIHHDNDFLWMSGNVMDSYRTGITIFDKNQNNFEYVESYGGYIYKADDVNDICSNEFDIFAATDNGIWVIDKKDRAIRSQLKRKSGLPDNLVLTLLVLGDTLFVGTEYGLGMLSIYADTIKRMTKTLLPSLTILCLEKANDYLWIGTTRGAYRLNLETGKISFLSASEITQTGSVFDIEFADEKMWLVTADELVSIDLKTADIDLFPEVNNYGGAKAITVKDTLLAVATGQGLLLIYNGKNPYYQFFTIADGLISGDIRDMVFDNEYLWLGTDAGLTRFWYKNPALR